MISDKRLEKINHVVSNRQRDLVMVLEDIHDPHNAAAIFRTCDAFGIQNVYLIFNKVEPYNPKQVGKASSATANKWLDFKIFKSAKECLSELKRTGYKIISTLLDENASNIYEFKWPEKIALVLGNEHTGLSSEAVKLSDYKIYIPMLGMVQSLNVSVATAIFLSEIRRNRLNKNCTLPPNKQQNLRESFGNR